MSQVQVPERVDARRVPVLQTATGGVRATLGGRLRFISVGVRALRVAVPQSMHLLTIKRAPNAAGPVNAPIASLFAFERQGRRATDQRC
jgi:hypothetical protein